LERAKASSEDEDVASSKQKHAGAASPENPIMVLRNRDPLYGRVALRIEKHHFHQHQTSLAPPMKRTKDPITSLELTARIQKVLMDGSIVATALPLTPEIHLHLLAHDYPKRGFASEEAKAIMDEPPYWAFCWASGQVLAKWILEHREIFQRKTVLDFGAGSGVAAIAAAYCGADKVIAVDIDPLAREAIQANGELNGVSVETRDDLASASGDLDIIVAADVLYDRENFLYFERFTSLAAMVLVADSKVKDLRGGPYQMIAQGEASTCPDLEESAAFRKVTIFEAKRPEATACLRTGRKKRSKI
jgi:predicted nicotinamide N-methyase